MRSSTKAGRRILLAVCALALACVAGLLLGPGSAFAESSGSQSMYRLYNPNSGEHFYTASTAERDNLTSLGWSYEGVGWLAPTASDTPVYRLYNPNPGPNGSGEHHYTMSAAERDMLVKAGWTYEGIGWYSDDAKAVMLYREYNPNAFNCNHNYTASKSEHDSLVALGWKDEGIGWYGLATTPIMGTAQTSVSQMVACYKASGKTYPASALSAGGAASIEDFCQILYEEATAEGVRPEVVFAQAMHETGWLQYGGDVKAEQFNFAGLGAAGGVSVNSFSSVREGLRAQVQHLKAYASTEPLNNECVDQRFSYVTRGCAPYVENLGGKWATSATYGQRIIAIMDSLLGF